MHGYPANYMLSRQIVTFFTLCICICIWPETFLLLSVSVSGQQNANRYRYLKYCPFEIIQLGESSTPPECQPLNATVLSDLELLITSTQKGLSLGSGGSAIVPKKYIKKLIMTSKITICIYICIRLCSKFLLSGNIGIRLSSKFYYPCIPTDCIIPWNNLIIRIQFSIML